MYSDINISLDEIIRNYYYESVSSLFKVTVFW